MRLQRVAERHARMVEGTGAVFLHAEPLHHRAGTAIGERGERDDLVEPDAFEAEAQRGACTFARQALAPIVMRQAPADLDMRRQPGRRRLQTDEADEVARGAQRRRPQPPAGPPRPDGLGCALGRAALSLALDLFEC